jgi:hypothetical protein
VLLGPPICLFGCLDEQGGEFAGLRAGEAVVAEIDVRRLVHAAVIDVPIGELDGCGRNTYTVDVDAVDTAEFAE